MITEKNAVDPRQNLDEMLNLVQYRHDTVLINKNDKPVAALINIRLFNRLRRMQTRFDALCERIETGYEGVDGAEGSTEIEAAVELERREQQKLR
jgi:prevent-host-death family protein